MNSIENIPTGTISKHLRIERTANSTPQLIVYPSRQLHDEREFREMMAAAKFHAKSDSPLRWRHDPVHTDWDALAEAVAWASRYAGPAHSTPITDGQYGHFSVEARDDGSYIVRCPYGKQSPLKRIEAVWSDSDKGWIVLAHRGATLRTVLDRAVSRAANGQDEVADILADIEALTTKHVSVKRAGDTIRLRTAYNQDAITYFRSNGGKWDAANKTWNFKISNRKAYDAAVYAISKAEVCLARTAEENAAEAARRAAEKTAQEARWAAERAEREQARNAEKAVQAERRSRRNLYPLGSLPPLNTPLRQGDAWIVYESYGKDFRISEDDPSCHGSHLLGHEGDYGRYCYYRDATPEERARAEAEESAAKAARAAEKARRDELRATWERIQRDGERPDGTGNRADGTTIYLSRRDHDGAIYGYGDSLVVGDEWIWAVMSNGSDGADWSVNNLRGAIGWRIPADATLAARLMELGLASGLIIDA